MVIASDVPSTYSTLLPLPGAAHSPELAPDGTKSVSTTHPHASKINGRTFRIFLDELEEGEHEGWRSCCDLGRVSFPIPCNHSVFIVEFTIKTIHGGSIMGL